jgi:glycosyltransferase involved in cell wall biosynthesis
MMGGPRTAHDEAIGGTLKADPPLRVVHLSGSDSSGGAGRGAKWLNEGLQALGVDSTIHFRRAELEAQLLASGWSTAPAAAGRLKLAANRRISTLVKRRGERFYYLAPFPVGLQGNGELLRGAQVVHLHWVADGSFSIPRLATLGMPLVITLRDMWPFTGGCSYDLDCGQFRHDCSACPMLKPFARGLAGWRQRANRTGATRSVRFVAISDWLRDRARESRVLAGHQIETISNAIDTRMFFPADSAALRQRLGIGEAEQMIVAGSLNLDDTYKNMAALMDLWRQIAMPRRRLVIFGRGGAALRKALPGDVVFLGPLRSDGDLRELYSAADVFVSPSLQEAFGKTSAEAAACGAPVVAFRDTGTADIVRHGETGILAPIGDNAALAAAVERVLNAGGRSSKLGAAARAHCVEHFSAEVVAKKYLRLYRELTDERCGGGRGVT